jgi:hypothetical protein
MRRSILGSTLVGASVALVMAGTAAASKTNRQVSAETVARVLESGSASVQLVSFPNTDWSTVKVVRGNRRKPPTEKPETAEIITFTDPQARVRVMRGEAASRAGVPGQPQAASSMTTQLVTFANFQDRPVSILRGSVPQPAASDLFSSASAADLDRVAFAVDGAESSHGADLRMWRPEPGGPQGPMQVTAAAADDVGGGDRFDLSDNRVLGRAYLARMYRRYGNWPDAVAAYNWGPANVDSWISGGRIANNLPLGVERYRDRVLRDAALAGPSRE